MIAVTTFSKDGYELYGKRLLESSHHWPTPIVCYVETDIEDEYESVTYKPLFDVYGLKPFITYCEHPKFRGQTPNGYDYNRDAVKFCYKVFAQFDVLQTYKGKVFWLDGDTEFKKDVPESFLTDLFQGKPLVYLGREGFHTESGFLGFDTEHEDFPRFLTAYIDCYRRGILFSLPRWHDCEAFDWARTVSEVDGNNLSSFFHAKPGGVTSDELNVFPKTVLGEYMKHNKGNRKYGRDKRGLPLRSSDSSVFESESVRVGKLH